MDGESLPGAARQPRGYMQRGHPPSVLRRTAQLHLLLAALLHGGGGERCRQQHVSRHSPPCCEHSSYEGPDLSPFLSHHVCTVLCVHRYYSFEYGQVHFISIDTEVDFPQSPEGPGTRLSSGPFGDQLTWLEADLKKAVANRAKVPWIIVGGHRPYYSSCGDITGSVQAAFEPLFLQYQVDVVFLGHIHWYERSEAPHHTHSPSPVPHSTLGPASASHTASAVCASCVCGRLYPTGANGTVQQQGYEDAEAPIYIVSASAGNVEGLSCPKLQPKDAKPFTAFFNGAAYGLGLLSVHNATNLEWAFYESAGGTMIDRVDIVKAKRWEQLQREAVVKPTPGAARLRAE